MGTFTLGEAKTRNRLDRALEAYTRWAVKHPWPVLIVAFVVLASAWSLATTLRVRGDFVRLLPSGSPTAERFSSTLERKGGGSSTLLVLIDSPDPRANQRFVDALQKRMEKLPSGMLESVQKGPGAERQYFEKWRWVFASRRDLLLIECEIRRERERQSPFHLDLDEGSCEDDVTAELGTDTASKEASAEPSEEDVSEAEASERAHEADLPPLQRLRHRIERERKKLDRFPSGYFRNDSGTLYAVVLRASSAGMGEFGADDLFKRVQDEVAALDVQSFHPKAVVGFAGDIPNSIVERQALIEDITIVSSVAVVLILLSILIYFRSGWVLLHIGFAVATGCGVAFGVAALAFGYLNAATSFLGSIILGNGINDSIVYLGRYRERRAHGESVEDALVEAATSCRRGTWLASVAASGAYAALMVTSFRGFSEFGLIGGVGMVTCWFATFGFCPASVTLVERFRKRKAEHAGAVTLPKPKFSPVLVSAVARFALRFPRVVLALALALVVIAALPLKGYLQDPWEYNFSNLRSKRSYHKGAGHWSSRADKIFKSRGSPVLLLADSMGQASKVADRVVEQDQKLTHGRWVQRVVTVYDRLGGRPELVKEKLAILARIRSEIDKALPRLSGADKKFAEDWRPPEDFRAPTPRDLPPLVRAQFSEKDGTLGTPVYVYLNPKLSQSRGENLLQIADMLESVSVGGHVVPNASRATVFAEMIRSMERDAPRATAAALTIVTIVSLLATHALRPAIAVLGSLLVGVWLTVGAAAWFDVRLNFLNFVALPLTFGIGIEYAINLYDRIRLYGGDIARGVASAGGAVGLCSLTTILGYGSLLFADNQALQSFGKYAVFGEVSCMLTALVIMPTTLNLYLKRRPKPESPE